MQWGCGSGEEGLFGSVDIDIDICITLGYPDPVQNPCLLGERLMFCMEPNLRPKYIFMGASSGTSE